MKNNESSLIYLLMGVFLFLTTGCNKDDEKSIPSLTTTQVTDITATAASCGGNISDDGGASVTVRGVVWGTSPEPVLENNTGKTDNGTGTGAFTSNLTGLTPGTSYHVRAYASNSEGTSYGESQIFSTLDGVVLITTIDPTNITLGSATCGGVITDDGDVPVTVRGVVWGANENPSLETNLGKTTDGTGIGSFTSSITGLTGNALYYVRAYASNTVGTWYGNQVSFTTAMPDGPGDPITDVDGNTYNTVWINRQLWMTENLRTSRYNDGTEIPQVTNNTAWKDLSTPGYCWYNNDETANKSTFGAMYNWYAVNTGILCPAGWHVPSNNEWTQLTTYLGGDNVAGSKLKTTGTEIWEYPNTGATNETGFSALPGGCRDYGNGNFLNLGRLGYMWSSTGNTGSTAFHRVLRYNNETATSNTSFNMKGGLSVRCVSNQ